MTTDSPVGARHAAGVSRRAFLGAAGLTALGAAGCSGKGLPGADTSGEAGSGSGEIQWWTNGIQDDVNLLKPRVTAFQAANPNITVKLLNIPDASQYYTKISTSAVGGSLPDVFFTRTFDIAPFVARDYLLPLGDLIEKHKDTVKPDDFWPAEVAQMSVNDQMYALPYDFSNFGMYINKTLLEKEGVAMPTADWTWDQLYELATPFVQKSGKRQTQWGLYTNTSDWFMMGVFKAHGGDTFSEDRKSCVISNDANVSVLQTWTDLMSQGVIPTAESMPTGVDIFASGLVPFKVGGSWDNVNARATIKGKFEWDVLPLPKGPTGKREVSTAGGCWSISKASKNQAAAWTFLEFIANEESENALIADVTRSIPARQSSAKRWEEVATSGKEPPANLKMFREQMGTDAVNWSYPVFWREFDQSWSNNMKTFGVAGKPKGILDKIQADTNAAAKRY